MTRGSQVPRGKRTSSGDAARLRAAVEGELGELTDAQWEDMIDLGLVDLDAPYSESEVEDILELVQRRFEIWGARPAPRLIKPATQDEARSGFGHALSWFAGSHKPPLGVRSFRKALMRDRLLDRDEALPWLFKLVADDAQEHDLPDHYSAPRPVSSPVPTVGRMWGDPILEFLDPAEGVVYWVPVVPNSNSNWLRETASTLATDLGWEVAEAALWVATGIAPTMDMIKTVYRAAPLYNPYGERIEMTIHPASPPRDVMRIYAEARREVVGHRTRLQTAKHLELAVFADERPTDEAWADSMHRWNKQFPKWRYPRKASSVTDVTQFARDAVAARRRFLATSHPGRAES